MKIFLISDIILHVEEENKMDFLDIAEYELKFQRHLLRQFDKLRKNKR